jgi:hypothetical protein
MEVLRQARIFGDEESATDLVHEYAAGAVRKRSAIIEEAVGEGSINAIQEIGLASPVRKIMCPNTQKLMKTWPLLALDLNHAYPQVHAIAQHGRQPRARIDSKNLLVFQRNLRKLMLSRATNSLVPTR